MPRNLALILIFSISMLSVLGMSAIMPVLPNLSKQFNIPSSDLWLAVSAFTFPGIIFAPLGGILSDKYGRKPVLIISLIIVIIGCIACFFVNSYQSLLFCRALQGIGTGTMATLSGILVGDLFAKEERAKVMGLSIVCVTITSAISPIIGGFFAEINWRIPFMLSLFAVPVLLLSLKIPFPKIEKTQVEKTKDYLTVSLQVLKNPNLLSLLLFSFLLFIITYGAHITYIPLVADYLFNSTTASIGYFFSVGAIATASTAMLINKLIKIFTEKKLLYFGVILTFMSSLIFLYIPFESLIYLATFIFGIAQGILAPIIGAKIISFTTAQTRGTVMAVNSTITRISQALGPFLASLAWLVGGAVGPYIFSLILCICLFPLISIIFRKHELSQVHIPSQD